MDVTGRNKGGRPSPGLFYDESVPAGAITKYTPGESLFKLSERVGGDGSVGEMEQRENKPRLSLSFSLSPSM